MDRFLSEELCSVTKILLSVPICMIQQDTRIALTLKVPKLKIDEFGKHKLGI